jgi:hypothetical protein
VEKTEGTCPSGGFWGGCIVASPTSLSLVFPINTGEESRRWEAEKERGLKTERKKKEKKETERRGRQVKETERKGRKTGEKNKKTEE